MANKRTVIAVNTNTAEVRDQEAGTRYVVGLAELSRSELIQAAKVRFPSCKGNLWLSVPNHRIIQVILDGEVPADIADAPPPGLTGPITPKQASFLRKLGSDTIPATKAEASALIDKLVGGNGDNVVIEVESEEVQGVTLKASPALPSSAEGALTAAIAAIAGQVAGKVDPEAIRQEAVSAAERAVEALDLPGALQTAKAELEAVVESLRPLVTQVVIPGREPLELEGRQHSTFPTVLRLLGAGLHVYLVGPPGTGKSTIAAHAAQALALPYGSISLDPTLPPSRLFGYQDAAGNYVSTVFRQVYEHGGVFLFDEMDNGHPGVLASINQALSNGHCAFPDGMVERSKDFRCVAAANTHGTGATRQFVGRNQLDAATLDRFVEVFVDIDAELEEALTLAESPEHGAAWLATVRRYRANAARHGLLVIFSPRASIEGARMLAAGFTVAEATAMRLEKGLAADVLSKVR